MEGKLYIINNGLKDLRGHYFETAVSIAEASRGLGLRPVLAAHVACPSDIVPDGLEFHPVFTTDHWMVHRPPPQPELRGVRGEIAPLWAHPIEALKEGAIDFERYLGARFLFEEESAQDVVPSGPPDAPLPDAPPVPRPGLPSRREQVERLLRAILPPAVQSSVPLCKAILRQTLPPVLWDCLRRLWKSRSVVPSREPEDLAPPLSSEAEDGEPSPVPDPLAILLDRVGASHEHEYCQRFKQDLERLLSLTGCAACDHVFLPTAHGRELGAILQLLSDRPTGSQPMFHLEFRHPPDMAGVHVPREGEHPYCTVHRAFFEYARRFPASERLRLYTDTEELSEEYERFSGLEFGILPIPFRAQLISKPARQGGPLCVAYFGDVREEKGFHWLPSLIDALMEEHLLPGRVRFLIQASLIRPEDEARCKAALEELKNYAQEHVRLVGLDGPLAPDLYYQLVSEADLLLCPYHPGTYRSRSSGTLTEAIAAGIPTVVPRGTWLARQQPPGSGETFDDRGSFIAAVRQICDHFDAYRSRARAGRDSWLARHSPERLVRMLVGEGDERRPIGRKVA